VTIFVALYDYEAAVQFNSVQDLTAPEAALFSDVWSFGILEVLEQVEPQYTPGANT
uniref:Protein kinase n=1 Tax=Rattus norvegicus TaxID=10116 RepID=Q7M036_RAT